MRHGEDNNVKCTENFAGHHPIQTIDAPTSIIPPILRWMPFLLQPSQFILAWDRHQICWIAYLEAWFPCLINAEWWQTPTHFKCECLFWTKGHKTAARVCDYCTLCLFRARSTWAAAVWLLRSLLLWLLSLERHDGRSGEDSGQLGFLSSQSNRYWFQFTLSA